MTFADLDARQRRLITVLHDGGVARGERIAVLSKNRPELLEVTSGALRAGVVPVPVNPLLAPPEVAYILEDAGARWLFTDRHIEPAPPVERVVTFGDAYERLLHGAGETGLADVVLTRPMHYKRDTTGELKGIWVKPQTQARAAAASADYRDRWSLEPDDVHLVCSPLSSSASHRFSVRTLEAGGTVLLHESFDPSESLAAVELFGVTTTFMLGSQLEAIFVLSEQTLALRDVSSVRLLAHSGGGLGPAAKRRAIDSFPQGSVWELYGRAEGEATRISSQEWLRKPGSVGRPEAGAEILIRDDAFEELPRGRVGQVWVRDPKAERFVYWNDRRKTRAAWRSGAFTMGDVGRLDDDGYLYLEARRHEKIMSGGVAVVPREVERVLAAHPSVADVVVYGARSDEWGQEVRAAVVRAFGQPLDPEALRKWARTRLPGSMCPRAIEVVDEPPGEES